ncbi:glutathione S-transferase [Monaibacterium marinum]|uniref:Glutathione S-transferase n=1 Tax=Pontivivens marinum TaxID=1690039 RepID=A0A2C9CQ51_9RHOB|nr:glutathione S-transferase family protein [Monaibacterium marinum]SOH93671.1 glutathione S-transferase [Monaibacterium marinum]
MLHLYTAKGTCGRATLIALEEAGADFDLTIVRFAEEQQKTEAFLAMNPHGRVPVLVTDQGVLTESPALLAYVAELYPDAGLMPTDPFGRAQVNSIMAYLCATVHPAHAHIRRGSRWADDPAAIAELTRKGPEVVEATIRTIEDKLTGDWLVGDRMTIADIYLFTVANWMEGDGIDIDTLPRIRDHRARIAARPATQRALAKEMPQ